MNRDEEIRRLAHQIWEAEGRPDGRHLEHWRQAEEIWEKRNAPSAAPAQAPARPRRRTAAPKAPRGGRRKVE